MTLTRRLATAALATALITAAAAGLAPLPQAAAETGVRVVDKCPAPSDEGRTRIDVLVLLDVSGSLRTNDPNNIRIDGTKDAVLVLDSLSGQFEDADIRVAIDSFHTNYLRHQDWIGADGVSTALLPRIEDIGAIPAGRTTTDYTEAIAGAWDRFAEAPADCRLLIWFTDGEHVTLGSAEEVQPEEWAELSDLCDGPAMESLRRDVWAGAVRLIADGGSGETLKYLYGETGRDCANSLQGDIYDDFDPADLGRVLHDIIAGPTEDLIFRGDRDKLPGETDTPPADTEYEVCAGGFGTREQPCLIPFRLDRSHESFRAFIDLTFIRQGVREPGSVHVVLRSPQDDTGDYHASPTIGGLGEIDPSGAGGEYRLIPPFSFYARAQYGSEIQIVGHQAAEQLADPNQWRWQWEGEWSLLFFGDTPDAQADARRAAAAVRFQTTDSPVADSLGLDTIGTLNGFVNHYPTGYNDVELRPRMDAADGEPVYATRRSLTDEPLDVVGSERRFELPGLLDHLVAWDREEGGGNGRNLREAIERRGGLLAVASLEQDFQYGGHPDLLQWERDIGSYTFTPGQLDELLTMIDGRDRAGDLIAAVDAGDTVWLPSGLRLGEPQVAGETVSLTVTALPGALAGTLILDEDSVQVLDPSPIASEGAPDAVADVSDTSAEPAQPLPVTPDPLVEPDPWSCDVPAVSRVPADGGTEGAFTCPVPLRLHTDALQDTELSAEIVLRIDNQQGVVDALLDGMWFTPGSGADQRVRDRLDEAVLRERRDVPLVSGRFTLVVPPPPCPPGTTRDADGKCQLPPPIRNTLAEFWPMLAVLMAAAVTARVLVAWRLRRWDPLGSADYATMPLPDDDGMARAPAPADVRHEICMDLRHRKTATDIDGVRLRSRWLPLLLGRAPMLSASSQSGDCVGPRGCRPQRRGGCAARVGADLANGWIVEAAPGQARLIVWDLPPVEGEALDRIDDSAREAARWLSRHREWHDAADATADEAGDPQEGDGHPLHRPADGDAPAGSPFDGSDDTFEEDTDPFGRTI